MYSNRLDYPVSLFMNVKETTNPKIITINDVINKLYDHNKFDKPIRELALTDSKQYKKIKNQLECIVFGKFSQRNAKSCVEYTPCLCFDIDEIVNPDTTVKLLKALESIDYVFAAYPSISNLGLRVLIWTDSTIDNHKEYYKQISAKLTNDIPQEFKRLYSLDPATKDISRLWFITPLKERSELYLNPDSVIVKIRDFVNIGLQSSSNEGEIIKLCIEIIDHRKLNGRNEYVMQLTRLASECGVSKQTILNHCLTKEKPDFESSEITSTVNKNLKSKKYNYNYLKIHHHNTLNPSPSKKGASKFHDLINFIQDNYTLRLNILSLEIECKNVESHKFSEFRREDLECDLFMNEYTGFQNMLNSILGSQTYVEYYNPIDEYISNLKPWNSSMPDHIDSLCTFIKTDDDDFWKIQFKKFIVRSLACSLNLIPFNKQILCLTSEKQNLGKTSFLRFLCPKPLKKYFQERLPLFDKDSYKALGTNIFINLDEVSSFSSKELSNLKSWISKDKVKLRPAYKKKDETMNRVANFLATTNELGILTDSENVRWLIFNIFDINHDNGKKNGYSKNVNIDLVYSQAKYLLDSGFDFEMTKEEIHYMEQRNKTKFSCISSEEEYILEYLQIPEQDEHKEYVGCKFLTAANVESILKQLSPNLKKSNAAIGRLLTNLGFPKTSKKINSSARKGYLVDCSNVPSHIRY